MNSHNVLIVDADINVCKALERHFEQAGYLTRSTISGHEAEILLQELAPDLIILDWHVEDLPGIELCRRIRRREHFEDVSILMTCANKDQDLLIRGLDTGADTFVSKPFSSREIVAMANAQMRRTRPVKSGRLVRFEDLELHPKEHRVRRNGRAINLGPTEYRLLAHFIERPRRVCTRDQLLDAVWGVNTNVNQRTIDVHIRRLRMSITNQGERELIRTIRGIGYAIDPD